MCSIDCRKIWVARQKKAGKWKPPKQPTREVKKKYKGSPRGRVIVQLGAIRARAERRKVPYELSPEWFTEQWSRQKGKCALTGFEMARTRTRRRGDPYSVSVDRIVPELGYVAENCRLVCFHANWMRGVLSDEELRPWAEALLRHLPKSRRAEVV